jgi:hypothetical protein
LRQSPDWTPIDTGLERVVLRWIADQVLRLTPFAHGAHRLAQCPAQQGNSDIRACKVFQRMDGDSALTFLRFHVIGLALLVLERPIPQLAWPNVRNVPRQIRPAIDTLGPCDDAQPAHGLVVYRHAPGDFGRFLTPDRLLSNRL